MVIVSCNLVICLEVHTRILGLDIGDRRIGVALSDPGGILATPLTILESRNADKNIAAITALLKQHEVSQIVAGIPLCMDGSIGSQAEKVQIFVEKLKQQTNIPVVLRDERLTTFSAQVLMREAHPEKRKKKTRDDAIAAALILQGYLDEIPN